MPRRLNSRWVPYKGTNIWAANFCGLGSDRQGVIAEIQTTEKFLCQQLENSVLVGVDLSLTEMTSELVEFFRNHGNRTGNPIRKMAIMGVSPVQRIRYWLVDKIFWPKNSKFFDGWEPAKAWLVSERF